MDFSQCLFDWQTLTGAFLAAILAGGTILILLVQIKKNSDWQKDQKMRVFRAARAGFPVTLDSFQAYSQNVATEFHRVLTETDAKQQSVKSKHFSFDPFPSELMVEAKEVISALDQPEVISLLSKIISISQLLHANCQSLCNPQEMKAKFGVREELTACILLAGHHYAMSAKLYPFARGEADYGPRAVLWEDVLTALNIFNIETIPNNRTWEKQMKNDPSTEIWIYD